MLLGLGWGESLESVFRAVYCRLRHCHLTDKEIVAKARSASKPLEALNEMLELFFPDNYHGVCSHLVLPGPV